MWLSEGFVFFEALVDDWLRRAGATSSSQKTTHILHTWNYNTKSCASLCCTPHTACHHCISITRGGEDLFLIQSVSAGVTSLALWLSPCLARSPISPTLAWVSLSRHGAGGCGCQDFVFGGDCVCVCVLLNSLGFRLPGNVLEEWGNPGAQMLCGTFSQVYHS